MVMSDVSSNGFMPQIVRSNNYSTNVSAGYRGNASSSSADGHRMMDGSTANSGAAVVPTDAVDVLDAELNAMGLNSGGNIGATTAATGPAPGMLSHHNNSNNILSSHNLNQMSNGAGVTNSSTYQSSSSSMGAMLMHSAQSFSSANPQLNGVISTNSHHHSSSHQHSQHRASAGVPPGALMAAAVATGQAVPTTSSTRHSSNANSNLYQHHQQHESNSQQYLGANAHLLKSDYGHKYNSSPNAKSILSSPKKHANGLNGYANLSNANSSKHSSAMYAMQHHQPHHHYNSRGGHQEGHLNGHSTAGHGHNGNGAGGSGHSRRSGGHNGVHNHMLNDHTNGMLNGHMLSQMHATSAGQKERPPLLRQLDTSNPQHDKITNQFKEVVWMLTQRPEVFDNIVPYVVGALNCEKIKLETSEKLAHILVAWSVAEPNFRFTGAKLSHYLCLPEQLSFNFKDHFLKCVRLEVDRMGQLIKTQSPANNQKLEGVLLFICELYLNMGDVEIDSFGTINMVRIDFLRDVLKDALLKILELSPFDKPFLIVGKALKLTGAALDESDSFDADNKSRNSTKAKTERIYTHIQAIQQDTNTSQNVRSVYARVLELRKCKWVTDDFRSSGQLPTGANSNHIMTHNQQPNVPRQHNHAHHQQQQHMQHHNQQHNIQHQQASSSATPTGVHSSFGGGNFHQGSMVTATRQHLEGGGGGGGANGNPNLPNGAVYNLGQHHQQQQPHHHRTSNPSSFNNVVRNGGQPVFAAMASHGHTNHHVQSPRPQQSSGRGGGNGGGMIGAQHHSGGVMPGHSNSVPSLHINGVMNGVGGLPSTSSYSSITGAAAAAAAAAVMSGNQSVVSTNIGTSVSVYQQNVNTIASINAEMPLEPVFFLTDGTAIPAHEAEFDLSTEYEPQGAAAAAHYIPEYFTRMGEGEMGPNAAGETGLPNPLLLPHDSALEAELNEALAAYEESANHVDLMNGAGDMMPRVHTLNDDEEQAFAEFLQASEQRHQQQLQQQQLPMPPPVAQQHPHQQQQNQNSSGAQNQQPPQPQSSQQQQQHPPQPPPHL
ncbi:uncharacterized protein LOC142337648 isoform X2 [Convolutriloba macropyga]|uniref:uncharacterized protein LOC142337648 isoform X2 n=1 Tax=Convolutriloba macropyga TaxID=536237 RepID=UPI003F52334E